MFDFVIGLIELAAIDFTFSIKMILNETLRNIIYPTSQIPLYLQSGETQHLSPSVEKQHPKFRVTNLECKYPLNWIKHFLKSSYTTANETLLEKCVVPVTGFPSTHRRGAKTSHDPPRVTTDYLLTASQSAVPPRHHHHRTLSTRRAANSLTTWSLSPFSSENPPPSPRRVRRKGRRRRRRVTPQKLETIVISLNTTKFNFLYLLLTLARAAAHPLLGIQPFGAMLGWPAFK